jgi:hypothetical protein
MPAYDLIVEAYMPNLENLKKQAKLILPWHRERHCPVALQIRGLALEQTVRDRQELLSASLTVATADSDQAVVS